MSGVYPNCMNLRTCTQAVKVSGNRRVTFKLRQGDAFDVDYEDYY
jgi:hypothetical protein